MVVGVREGDVASAEDLGRFGEESDAFVAALVGELGQVEVRLRGGVGGEANGGLAVGAGGVGGAEFEVDGGEEGVGWEGGRGGVVGRVRLLEEGEGVEGEGEGVGGLARVEEGFRFVHQGLRGRWWWWWWVRSGHFGAEGSLGSA